MTSKEYLLTELLFKANIKSMQEIEFENTIVFNSLLTWLQHQNKQVIERKSSRLGDASTVSMATTTRLISHAHVDSNAYTYTSFKNKLPF